MELSKKKLSNFDLIFCVINVLHKKSGQNLSFFESSIVKNWFIYSFMKNVPLLQVGWPDAATPTPLTVKDVYEVWLDFWFRVPCVLPASICHFKIVSTTK